MTPSQKAQAPAPSKGQEKPLFNLNPKQKRMLTYTFGALALAAIGGGIFYFFSSAPDRARAQYEEAMKSMKPGYYQTAIEGFNKAIEIWSGLGEAYFERGNAYHILGKDDDAVADYEKATEVNPNLYRAYAALGSIYRNRNDQRRAMEAYTKSINAKPNVDAFFERGQMYEALGEHQKAIDDYTRAILELPGAPAIYRARGMARRNIGDQKGYEEDRDQANAIEHR